MMVHKFETIKNKEHFLHLGKKKKNTSCNYVVATKVDCLALWFDGGRREI